ncbi:flagellar basal body L-ring protein FlgH [Paracidovorax valerianellae]|uniref:Flagellar L-ring protein n=1 Tax=Paracidovorax valerianellae TaxID=187868 RepID=A0A1G7D2W7_9BURK|nr:flagellar basal body L-ring protein FlgH [Paracidovorax valerianellae]MDA8447248.1 flagellar basal body L-ring protein FlgH [Paracidovorax valerianellae]SDE45932.1 flagellar L-ring protein precursor FlgH [Paracidovorax valerianellae]
MRTASILLRPFTLPAQPARLAAVAGLVLLCTGCATLSPPPPVDLLPTAPPPVAATPRPSGPATGSLFHAASYRPVFEDRRARLVGDVVTIQIIETVSASQKSTSTVDRKSGTASGITALPFISSTNLGKASLGATSTNNFEGKGGTESTNTFTGTITTTVIDVLPNGHLVIAGEKQIGVNDNVDVLRFSGTVDPRALQPGSVISSTLVANARVQSRGRGAQSEAQAMGWLSRAFNSVTPF